MTIPLDSNQVIADTVVFNSAGEIVSLRSYFTPSDVAAL